MMMRLYCHHPYKPIQTPIISPSLSPSNLSLSPRRLSCSLLHPTTPLHLRSSTFLCSMNTSDMTSQLEIEKPEERIKQEKQVNGIFWIILLNIGVFVADHFYQVRAMQSLYFYHNRPAWFQYVTSIFCHANWAHLSSNLYFLYIFGKLVEEEEGSFGLWLSYILTGAGANIVSWLLLPRNTVSVRASGAVYGLFAISVLVKMSWDWRKILEVLILGQFVIGRVTEAAQASTAMLGFMRGSPALEGVDHIAHLSGALIGVLLIWLINLFSSLPDAEDLSNKQNKNE